MILAVYAIGLFGIAQWVSRDSGQAKTTEDYFLAGRTLPWWAIGASLIAANISAEQIIGQSGQGFVVGLAIVTTGEMDQVMSGLMQMSTAFETLNSTLNR